MWDSTLLKSKDKEIPFLRSSLPRVKFNQLPYIQHSPVDMGGGGVAFKFKIQGRA